MWKGWTNGLLGTWLIIAAFIKFNATGAMWDNLIVGLIVTIVGFMMIKEKPWQGWLGGLSGLALFFAAFVKTLQTGAGYMWTVLILGLLIAIAGYGALGKNNENTATN